MFKQKDLDVLENSPVITERRLVKKIVEAFLKTPLGQLFNNENVFDSLYSLISTNVYGLTHKKLSEMTYLELIFLFRDTIVAKETDPKTADYQSMRLTYILHSMINSSRDPICNLLKSVSVGSLVSYVDSIHCGVLKECRESISQNAKMLRDFNGDFNALTLAGIIEKGRLAMTVTFNPLAEPEDYQAYYEQTYSVYKLYRTLIYEQFATALYNRWDLRKFLKKMSLYDDLTDYD